ncbi:MAG: uridine kinase [Rickettsiales bacterium]
MKNQDKPIIIGIAGASGSGKTKFSSAIIDYFKDFCIGVLREDSYYNDQSHLRFEERLKTNYDHPNAFDHDLLCSHLDQLFAGEEIEMPIYDYAQHTRSNNSQTIKPSRILILEGILILAIPEILKRIDVKIFIDAPLDLCLLRRIKRDVLKRERDVESVMKQYVETVRPMFVEFIRPSKFDADVIVPRGGKNQVAIDMVCSKIRHILGIC